MDFDFSMYDLGEVATEASSFYQPVIDIADDFGDWFTETAAPWMEANPIATKALGGAATGAITYYNQQESNKNAMDLYERKKNDALALAQGSSGIGTYAARNGQLTGGTGLLTNGRLTQK